MIVDRRFAHAARHPVFSDRPYDGIEIGVLRRIGPLHRIFDEIDGAFGDEAGKLVRIDIILPLQIEHEAMAENRREAAHAIGDTGGICRELGREQHHVLETQVAGDRRLRHGLAEIRTDRRYETGLRRSSRDHRLHARAIVVQAEMIEVGISAIEENAHPPASI